MLFIALNACGRAKVFHHLVTASHRAAECATDANVRFASVFLAQHRIETDQLENVDWLQAELDRDPGDGFVANETEMFLPEMEERKRRASFLIGRIMPDRFVHSAFLRPCRL